MAAVAEPLAAPLRIGVAGRRGVGRRTVARALGDAGAAITTRCDVYAADVVVYVVAEVVKPEDASAVAALAQPAVVVLNKADLPGCADVAAVSTRIGAPTVPMSGLFALAARCDRLDERLWTALQVLAAEPAELSCSERFVTGPHRVPPHARIRLRDSLDMSGIAHLVDVARRGGSIGRARDLLRRLSGVDAVFQRVSAAGAAVRYRRLSDAVVRLETLAVGSQFSDRIGDFLSRDATVLARMAAAAELAEPTGVAVDPADDPAAQLRQAVRLRRRRRAPLDALQHACMADIVSGLLRLRSPAGGSA